jgi:hypothetical protein
MRAQRSEARRRNACDGGGPSNLPVPTIQFSVLSSQFEKLSADREHPNFNARAAQRSAPKKRLRRGRPVKSARPDHSFLHALWKIRSKGFL